MTLGASQARHDHDHVRLDVSTSAMTIFQSAAPFFLDALERAVVRPLEAPLDPLAYVADGLDDDGHFCTSGER